MSGSRDSNKRLLQTGCSAVHWSEVENSESHRRPSAGPQEDDMRNEPLLRQKTNPNQNHLLCFAVSLTLDSLDALGFEGKVVNWISRSDQFLLSCFWHWNIHMNCHGVVVIFLFLLCFEYKRAFLFWISWRQQSVRISLHTRAAFTFLLLSAFSFTEHTGAGSHGWGM